MKRLINTLIALMLTIIFIPNVYGEEYNYYEVDFSSKEALNKNMNEEIGFKNQLATSFLRKKGKIMVAYPRVDDSSIDTTFMYDENGNLLLKIGILYNEARGPVVVEYEVGENAPEVLEYLFTTEDKESFNKSSSSSSSSSGTSNFAVQDKGIIVPGADPSFLSEYDGIRLRFREEQLEYTSDKTCTSVCINKVKMVNRTSKSITKDVPKFDGLEINFDLSFKEVNEEVNYEVNIYNPTDKDYEISTPESSTDKDFVKYDYKFENDDNVLKAKSNKTMYVSVRYNKEVDSSSFVDGVFKEENKAVIKLSNGVEEAPVPIEIPDTYTGISIFIIFALVAGLGYISYNKLSGKMMLLFIPLLLIPVIVFAYERLEVKVNTNVEIEKTKLILMARSKKQKLQANTDTYYMLEAYSPKLWDFNDYIVSITFENKMREISEYAYKFDVSEKQDNSIIAYLVLDHENNNKKYYNAYIMADDTIYANPNSSGWFADMSSLELINNMEYLDTSLVTNMESMFNGCELLKEIDLSHFDTSKVINMTAMFSHAGMNADSFNIIYGDKFIIGNNTDVSGMYCNTGKKSNFEPPKDSTEISKVCSE